MWLISTWIFIRVFIGVIAAYISSLVPMLPIEKAISLWPPVAEGWLERVIFSPLMRWDAHWYLKIITEGYSPLNGTTQFHPLYPLLAKGVTCLGFHPVFSLLVVSSISGLGFLWICYLLVSQDLPREQAKYSVMFLLIFPLSVVLYLPYTEATFLFFAAACFYTARQKNWLLAGLAAGLASLTRQQGVFLLFPLLWMVWQDYSVRKGQKLGLFIARGVMIIGFVALAELVWLYFRWRIGDLTINLSNLNSFIYSVLISPKATEVVSEQAFIPPWQVLGHVIKKISTQPDFDVWLNLIGIVIFLWLFALSWPVNRKEERLYNVIILLTSLSYYTGPTHPVMGILRHLYLAFPVIMGAAFRFRTPSQKLLSIGLCAAGMVILIFGYVFIVWVM